ncbi:MAG: hypothetical protein WDN29_16320 [Methylovirgula sp.]
MKVVTICTRSTKKGNVERIVRGDRIIIKGTRAQIEAELVILRTEQAEGMKA